jgi:hypothetical protein
VTDLADYRVIFATPGTPPRTLRAVRPADDPDLPDWLIYVDGAGREVWRLNRDVVLFVERLDREDTSDGYAGEPATAVIHEAGGQPDGLGKVAAAIRRARGDGGQHPQIRGFA